jgi:hypothetical protein
MGKLRFKRFYKELNKMEYSKKYLFMTFVKVTNDILY